MTQFKTPTDLKTDFISKKEVASEVSFISCHGSNGLKKKWFPKRSLGASPGVLDRFLRGPLHNVERFHVSILSFTGELAAEQYKV